MSSDEVADQLRDEIEQRVGDWFAFLGTRDSYLTFEAEAVGLADRLAMQVRSDDERERAEIVADLMATLWPRSEPPVEWWSTPLGLCIAASVGWDLDAVSVTQQAAAEMLGVTRGTVAQLVHRGDIERHPYGGLLRSSVLARLARLRAN